MICKYNKIIYYYKKTIYEYWIMIDLYLGMCMVL